MDPREEKLNQALAAVRAKTDFKPDIALTLGSGLGAFAEELHIEAVVDYADIEGFPRSTVPGHAGRFVFGTLGSARLVVMQGRVHFYEGYPISDVVLPARLMRMLGARVLFLTNAAGGADPEMRAGDFMLIRDQIANFVENPLRGANLESLGTRFPDMSAVYDPEISDAIKAAAKAEAIPLREGTYIQLTGPNFETPAEVRMCRLLGADAIGMSTAVEAMAAHHAGMRVCGVSCIANLACGLTDKPLTHEEVQAAGAAAAPQFTALIRASIARINDLLETGKEV